MQDGGGAVETAASGHLAGPGLVERTAGYFARPSQPLPLATQQLDEFAPRPRQPRRGPWIELDPCPPRVLFSRSPAPTAQPSSPPSPQLCWRALQHSFRCAAVRRRENHNYFMRIAVANITPRGGRLGGTSAVHGSPALHLSWSVTGRYAPRRKKTHHDPWPPGSRSLSGRSALSLAQRRITNRRQSRSSPTIRAKPMSTSISAISIPVSPVTRQTKMEQEQLWQTVRKVESQPGRARALHAEILSPTAWPPSSAASASTSTTRSCRASRARSPLIIRRTSAA